MPTPTHKLYIARKPHEVNGLLAAQEGRLLLIVPNYTEVFPEPPKVTDGQTQVFAVEVPHDQVVQLMDGGVQKLLLWTGDANARTRPHDKLTLPVQSLIPLSGDTQSEFDSLPDAMKLAVVLSAVSEQSIIDLPVIGPAGAAKLRAWAAETVAKAQA